MGNNKKIISIGPLWLSLFLIALVLFFVFAINQLYQFSRIFEFVHPLFSDTVFISLFVLLTLFLASPLYLYLRYGGFWKLDRSTETYHQHLEKLEGDISSKSSGDTAPMNISNSRNIHERLDELCDLLIMKSGKSAFLTTAISQNGAFDFIAILSIQIKLVWQVIKIYKKSPQFTEVLEIYVHVFIVSFIASSLDEAEYLEVIEPMINIITGSAIGTIPGTSIIVDSVISGSANAFLTMRTGLITMQYSKHEHELNRNRIRKNASSDAGKMLITVSRDGAIIITKKVGSTLGDKVSEGTENLNKKIKNFRNSVSKRYKSQKSKWFERNSSK